MTGTTARADEVVALARSRPPLLGDGRLVCIDGPAGSGKSTLAEQVSAAGTGAVIHLDELLDGWTGGLTTVVEALVTDVLEPLAAGRAAAYHRYDWVADRFAEWVTVPPTDLLVVEGVASGSAAVAPYTSVLVWMDAPREVRKARGIARDGEAFAPYWDMWAEQEAEHFAREATRSRADVVVCTA